MPPKKTTGATKEKKAAAAPAHASYKDMIKDAILTLKERNGSSRQALKKYILANNKTAAASPSTFESHFNKAIRSGVEKGDFTQPKGASGPVKLAKKEPSVKPATTAAKPAAAPKKTSTTTTKPKAEKKTTTAKPKAEKKTTTAKKVGAPKKTAAAKPKANTATKRATPKAAPAVVPVETVLGKTKSGRVTKGPAKPTASAKKATTKKATTPKKKATPKKAAATAETTA